MFLKTSYNNGPRDLILYSDISIPGRFPKNVKILKVGDGYGRYGNYIQTCIITSKDIIIVVNHHKADIKNKHVPL